MDFSRNTRGDIDGGLDFIISCNQIVNNSIVCRRI